MAFEESTELHGPLVTFVYFLSAKVWLEPKIEVAHTGKTLKTQELNKALRVIEHDLEYLLEEWHGYKHKAINWQKQNRRRKSRMATR